MTQEVTAPEYQAMRQAIAASAAGCGTTSPNPPVGCVVLDKHGAIVGTGYHARKGQPHAEVHALQAAGNRAHGATAAVTLEPCNHTGSTPACHQALIDAGISRVLIAVTDPTSRPPGGITRLREAGLQVLTEVAEPEARTVLAPWLAAQHRRRPWLTWTQPEEEPAVTDADLLLRADALADYRSRAAGHDHEALHAALASRTHAETLLSSLFTAGVRHTVLIAEPEHADPYLRAGLVDDIRRRIPTPPPSTTGLAEWLLPGFALHTAMPHEDTIEVRAMRAATHDDR